MHIMRAQFQARCFAFFAGKASTLTQEPKRAIYWDGVYAHYYNEAFLHDVGETEEQMIRTALDQTPSTCERKDLIARYAARWDEFRHYGDIPTQQEILASRDILVRDQRRVVANRPQAIAAAKGKRPTASVKYWLADTGCGYDLVARKHVAKFTDKIKQTDNPIMFNTANGMTDATNDILLRVEELDEDVEPYVLDSTPAVLSVGRRCVDFGYAFHWPAGSHKPYFVTPKGKRIELIVQDYVPYVKTKLAKHKAMTVISKAEVTGIIAVNHAEQLPRASQVALAGHDRRAKANFPSTTTGHESARIAGGPVVAVPPDGLIRPSSLISKRMNQKWSYL